jgi:hypothetical protein
MYEDFKHLSSKSTGLALSGASTLLVTSRCHAFRLTLEPAWRPDVHWPSAFRRAAAATLLAARFGARHAAPAATGAPAPLHLWNLPHEIVLRVVRYAAGERSDWALLEDPDECVKSPSSRIAEGLALMDEVDTSMMHTAQCGCEVLLPNCAECARLWSSEV